MTALNIKKKVFLLFSVVGNVELATEKVSVSKKHLTLIHEIWLLLINYSFLWFYHLLFLKYEKIDNR